VSDKPSAAWYLAPIFLGIIGSVIMWFVLKDEAHPDARKMAKKGWIIGIALTLISFWWIPFLFLPLMMMGDDGVMVGDHMQIPEPEIRMAPEQTQQLFERTGEERTTEPIQQQVPAPGFEDVPEMIVEPENNCDSSYPDVCIPPWPPDLNCGDVRYSNFRVLPDDPHGFDRDNDGIGCES